jgi:hypothetical protein
VSLPSKSGSRLHEMKVDFSFETQNAVKVRKDCDSPWVFLPKSLIECEVSRDGYRAEITAPEWLLIEKGLV